MRFEVSLQSSLYITRPITIQVLLDLPEKSEVILYTGLSALQKKYYKAILTKDLGTSSTLSLLLLTLSGLSIPRSSPFLF